MCLLNRSQTLIQCHCQERMTLRQTPACDVAGGTVGWHDHLLNETQTQIELRQVRKIATLSIPIT